MFEKRDYQVECLNIIDSLKSGSYLIRMATGLGKTYVFTHIKRKGRVLVIAHREELIYQTAKYYNCPVGIEMAEHKSNGEEVIVASVLSLVRRLDKFNPNDFDTIIVDEAHHAPAKSYMKILEYFNPRLILGFTATPKRGDNVGLDGVFSGIVYDKDIKWGIKNNYLTDIDCLRINVGYKLDKVKSRMGDFALGELDEAVNIKWANKIIGDIYKKHAVGQTLIFATSVEHAFNIQKEIKGSYVVTAKTQDRQKILKKFAENKIKCLINVDVFTEGTDLPNIQTIIMARPTQSVTAYIQRVGRGLRPHKNKDKLLLIDCVGDSEKHNLCTAPSLFGLSTELVPKNKLNNIQGNIFSLEEKIKVESDVPESWIKNSKFINIWAKDHKIDLMGINFFQMPDGSLNCRIPAPKTDDSKINKQEIYTIPYPDELGYTYYLGKKIKIQEAIIQLYSFLNKNKKYCESIWNMNKVSHWGGDKATSKQLTKIKELLPNFNLKNITKLEASEILNRLFGGYVAPSDNNMVKSFNVEKDIDLNKLKEYVVLNISTTQKSLEETSPYRITAVKFNSNGEKIDEFDKYVYSPTDTARRFYKSKGITNPRMLPSVQTTILSLYSFIGDAPVLAHKIEYALKVLEMSNTSLEAKFYDTKTIAENTFKGFKSYSLETLSSLLLLNNIKTKDFSMDKINLTNELILACKKRRNMNVNE